VAGAAAAAAAAVDGADSSSRNSGSFDAQGAFNRSSGSFDAQALFRAEEPFQADWAAFDAPQGGVTGLQPPAARSEASSASFGIDSWFGSANVDHSEAAANVAALGSFGLDSWAAASSQPPVENRALDGLAALGAFPFASFEVSGAGSFTESLATQHSSDGSGNAAIPEAAASLDLIGLDSAGTLDSLIAAADSPLAPTPAPQPAQVGKDDTMPARELTSLLEPIGTPNVAGALSEQLRACSPFSPSSLAFDAGYAEGAMQAVVAARFNDGISEEKDAEQVNTTHSPPLDSAWKEDVLEEEEDAPPPPDVKDDPPPPPPDES
jgi:hypothetical protein